MKTRNELRGITHTMKRLYCTAVVLTAMCGLALSSYAQGLVSNVWNTGVYTYPAPPTYSEMGTDSNSSGDLESWWSVGGSGTLDSYAGHLVMTNVATGSSSFTTYFTPEGSEVTLANGGDQLKVTWVFTPQGVNTSNTSQGFALGVADTPGVARLTNNASPGSAVYAMYMNMGNTLKNSNPFLLKEWNASLNSDFIAHQGNWLPLTNGVASGAHGYDSGTSYTFTMTLTRDVSDPSKLDVLATMIGGTINGSGTASVYYVDSTPNSWTYDTFGLRPSNSAITASYFDTTLFQVDYIPEPSTLVLAGAGLGLMIAMIRRRRRS
jgi:hypothetical protein